MRYVICLENGPYGGAWIFNENSSYLYTYKCMEGVTLCYFMCSFRYWLLFNILNSLDRVRCSIMQLKLRVHLSLIVFYAGVKTAKNGVWLTEPIFLILGRGHIHIAHHPPMPTHGPAALQPCSRSSPARYSRSLEWFKDLQWLQLKEKIL